MTIDQIEKEFDKFYEHIDGPGVDEEIKSFYRQKITELLEELAKEAIGELKNYQLGMDGFKNIEDISNSIGYNSHRKEVISAFERRGIKV